MMLWRTLTALGLGLCCTFALAQDPVEAADEESSSERARIQRERAQEQARFDLASAACYQRFAVNDCQQHLREKKRLVMDDLKRQEAVLNDVQRKKKAWDQLARVQSKTLAD